MTQLTSLWNLVSFGSVRAAVLIAIVFALRWTLRGRVPAQCFHWLWVLVAIRLLVLVIPGSATSIFNLLSIKQTDVKADTPAWVIRKESAAAPPAAAAKEEPIPPDRAAPVAVEAGQSLPLLPLAWLVGVVVHVMLLGRSALRMRRAIRTAAPVADPSVLALARDCAAQLGVRKPIELRETSAACSPAIVGLWHPRLILPCGLTERLNSEELRFVLLHEYAHLCRRDLLVMWLLTAARIIHWFNPLTWLAVSAARVDTELACDETLLLHSTEDAPVPYGETLLKLTQLTSWRQAAIPVVAITEGKRAMRLRLEHIASFSRHSRWRIAAALAVVLGAGLVFAADETSKPLEIGDPAKVESAKVLPKWAKDWSIVRVTLPKDKEASKAEIEFRTGAADTKKVKVGEASETEPWVEKLEAESAGGESHWIATLRKGEERADCPGPCPIPANRPGRLFRLRSKLNSSRQMIRLFGGCVSRRRRMAVWDSQSSTIPCVDARRAMC
jgi:beta-lactamase regulating signal transducer with metallopeptidase domain